MTTFIIPKQPPITERQLSYLNGENVFKVNDEYFLIAQCDAGMMILFYLETGMEWNRRTEPVKVSWNSLTTETIKNYFPKFKDCVVERVNAKITFEIL